MNPGSLAANPVLLPAILAAFSSVLVRMKQILVMCIYSTAVFVPLLSIKKRQD